jgi:formate hydrogenlyase subunit 4
MAPAALAHLALALALSPLLPGVADRVKALFAGRAGRPLAQRYFDLARLARKGAVYSVTTTWVFRFGPVAALAAPALGLLVLPAGGTPALAPFAGDLFLLLGLLGLARFAVVAAALDTGSPFEGMGGSREASFSALAEPVLFLVFVSLARRTGELSLSPLFHRIDPWLWQHHGAMLAMLAAALFCVLLAENSRVPVDDPNTHLELTMIHEAMVLDHSGPDLAAITWGACLKLWIFSSLVASLAVPVRTGDPWIDGAAHLGGVFAVAALTGAVESVTGRLRLTSVPQFLAVGGALALLSLLLLMR